MQDASVKILCVDHETGVLRALQRLFLDSDYEIITASSGEEGISVLKTTEDIRVVIADYRMPGMNGIDFLQQVYALRPDTVRIVLSGYADTAAIVEAINEGQIYKFIPKPWNDDELKVTIANALDRYFLYQKNIQLAQELELKNRELQEINSRLERLVEERTADLVLRNRILTAAQNILDTLPLAVVGIDPDGLVVQCNQKGRHLFSMHGGSILGMDRNEALPEQVNLLAGEVLKAGTVSSRITGNGADLMAKGIHMKYPNGQEGIILVFDEGGTV